MTLDLTDDEARALAKNLRQALDYDPYPMTPRLDPLKAILAKPEPPAPRKEPLPPLKAGMAPSSGRGSHKWRRIAMAALCLALLLTACGTAGNANAELGPNPGGSYFGANVNVGTVNPSRVYDGI